MNSVSIVEIIEFNYLSYRHFAIDLILISDCCSFCHLHRILWFHFLHINSLRVCCVRVFLCSSFPWKEHVSFEMILGFLYSTIGIHSFNLSRVKLTLTRIKRKCIHEVCTIHTFILIQINSDTIINVMRSTYGTCWFKSISVYFPSYCSEFMFN